MMPLGQYQDFICKQPRPFRARLSLALNQLGYSIHLIHLPNNQSKNKNTKLQETLLISILLQFLCDATYSVFQDQSNTICSSSQSRNQYFFVKLDTKKQFLQKYSLFKNLVKMYSNFQC